MLAKLFFTEIAQDSNFPSRFGPRDIGQLVDRMGPLHHRHIHRHGLRASQETQGDRVARSDAVEEPSHNVRSTVS